MWEELAGVWVLEIGNSLEEGMLARTLQAQIILDKKQSGLCFILSTRGYSWHLASCLPRSM